jgi:hypothetical protein
MTNVQKQRRKGIKFYKLAELPQFKIRAKERLEELVPKLNICTESLKQHIIQKKLPKLI